MAAVTAGVITAASAAASAYSGYRGAKSAEDASKRADARADSANFNRVRTQSPFGTGTYNRGDTSFNLSPELQAQMSMGTGWGNFFADMVGGNQMDPARDVLSRMGGIAYNQIDPNTNLFANLQNMVQGNMGVAQAGIGRAGEAMGQLDPYAMRTLGMAGEQLNDVGSYDAVRGRTLDLLRQQAEPFESRALQNLGEQGFISGRGGSSGGALQMEAFGRGLAQADLDRQLAASAEGMRVQNNAANLAGNLFGQSGSALSLGDQLMSTAFSNFGNFAGLATDIDRSRFDQASRSQGNLWDQMGQYFSNTAAMPGMEQSLWGNAMGLSQGGFNFSNSIPSLMLPFMENAMNNQNTQSQVRLGNSNVNSYNAGAYGQRWDAMGAGFGGFGNMVRNGGLDWLGEAFGGFGNKQPTTPTGPGTEQGSSGRGGWN